MSTNEDAMQIAREPTEEELRTLSRELETEGLSLPKKQLRNILFATREAAAKNIHDEDFHKQITDYVMKRNGLIVKIGCRTRNEANIAMKAIKKIIGDPNNSV